MIGCFKLYERDQTPCFPFNKSCSSPPVCTDPLHKILFHLLFQTLAYRNSRGGRTRHSPAHTARLTGEPIEGFRFASTSINPTSVADLREFRVTRINLETRKHTGSRKNTGVTRHSPKPGDASERRDESRRSGTCSRSEGQR